MLAIFDLQAMDMRVRDKFKDLLDIKAPTPCDLVGKDTTQKRSNDRRNTENRSHHADKYRPFVKRDDLRDDDDSSRIDPCTSHARNGTANNERIGVRRRTTHHRSNLEESNGQKIDGLRGIKGIDASPDKLSCAAGDQVGARVPSYVR